MKQMAVVFSLAFALLVAAPSAASAAESVSAEFASISGSTSSLDQGFTVRDSTIHTAVSGDSAPFASDGRAYTALLLSPEGLVVSVPSSYASASPGVRAASSADGPASAADTAQSADSTGTHDGFSAFLAQPTFVGLSMGALLWIAIAIAALTCGLLALGRGRTRGRQSSAALSLSD